jgi:hypothetical protein
MRKEIVKSDITVIGGGLAGVCAAVAAARLGRKVSLVQNRPVLGGNSSSEMRVWVCGATAHGTQRYARETGIMGEMFIENQYQNPDGNPYLWDLVILETVKAEPNIQLFLNTDVHEVHAVGNEHERSIVSVTGWMMGSERKISFESEIFLDCTGDGLVGFLAGAQYKIGREARSEYNEEWAPEKADDITLGSTILFYTKDVGHPVTYRPPSFAKDISKTSIPIQRVIRAGDNGCHYWWIEWGGELDTVYDNERIRDELWAVIYGIWDYIKNSGQFEADNMTLEWVGSLPGKREYRRFVGDYVLNQNDILEQHEFEDRIAFGGWSIDLHPPEGMYSTESGSKHKYMNGNYHIPYRSLYSKNVTNLMFAGRNISATHVAFGTTRVMATCAVLGEAAGTGAALAVKLGTTPRGVYLHHLSELQQTLLKQDASVLGLVNDDPADLGRIAQISASSTLRTIAVESPEYNYPLAHDVALIVPIVHELSEIEFLVSSESETTLEVELWQTGLPQNYVPQTKQLHQSVPVQISQRQWIKVPLAWKPIKPENAFIIVRANMSVSLHMSNKQLSGALSFEHRAQIHAPSKSEAIQEMQPVVAWSGKNLARKLFCFRMPATDAYDVSNVTDGYLRPYGGTHMWMSESMTIDSQPWIGLSWDNSVLINELHIVFNDDVNEDLINLHHHRTPFEIIPELVKDYKVEAYVDGKWTMLIHITNNHKRKRVHQFPTTVQTSQIRLIVEATNGSKHAEIIEIRVY